MYIEKDASINQDIERLRLRATSSLMEREDVVIVATVSAIYGLGDPAEYRKLMVTVKQGEHRGRDAILAELVRHPVRAQRCGLRAGKLPGPGRLDRDLSRLREQAIRVELWGDEVERSARSIRSPAKLSCNSSSAPSTRPSTSSRSGRPSSERSKRFEKSWRSDSVS